MRLRTAERPAPTRSLRAFDARRELDSLAVAKDDDGERRAGDELLPHRDDALSAPRFADLDAADREDDVAADEERLAVDGGLPRARAQTRSLRRRSGRHPLDQHSGRLRHVEDLRELVAEDEPLHAAPERPLLEEERPDHVRADDEPEPLEAARLRDDVAHDPDHLAGQVEHGAAGIALVDRSVRLEELRARQLAVDRVRLVPRAEVADRERVAEPVGRADDEDLVADLDLARVAEHRGLDALGHALELEEGDVSTGL